MSLAHSRHSEANFVDSGATSFYGFDNVSETSHRFENKSKYIATTGP